MSRYEEIAGELRELIASGEFPPGSHLPTQAKLAEQYQAAKNTVKEALKVLRTEGWVKTSQGEHAGPLVLEPPEPRPDLADIARRLERLEKHVFGDSAPGAS